ncbi:CLUMA_CG007381, isoform A [Clunio marinus]|uniref:CLUMA_CG007381, isoform A n=1 Tax=Clunio marinus TaxID=568069 RepID=A0A1J1I4N7_9DIPT|nr:CLUMA_CG007381, isoform A [Clunio marinus]
MKMRIEFRGTVAKIKNPNMQEVTACCQNNEVQTVDCIHLASMLISLNVFWRCLEKTSFNNEAVPCEKRHKTQTKCKQAKQNSEILLEKLMKDAPGTWNVIEW